MNGFLVLLCHTMDDLPIGLFATREEAMRLAEITEEDPLPWIRELYGTDCATPDCATPVCVKVVEFKASMPVSVDLEKDFEEVPA